MKDVGLTKRAGIVCARGTPSYRKWRPERMSVRVLKAGG